MPISLASAHAIPLRLATLDQAFDRFDPSAIDSRRLSPDVADYIVHRAEEFPLDSPLRIVVHQDDGPTDRAQVQILSDAVRAHFQMQSDWERDERHEVFRTGQQFLVIGLLAYAAGALWLWFLQQTAENTTLYRFARDSSVILAWVVVWRPAEIFFYDWLPIRKRRKLFDRIAAAPVRVAQRPQDG